MGRLRPWPFSFSLTSIFNVGLLATALLGSAPKNGWAISKQLRQELNWEYYANSANSVDQRPPQDQRIFHYEVPVDLLSKETGFTLEMPESEAIKQSLFFDKIVNGEKKTFIRWIINPEDTAHHMFIRQMLVKRGYDGSPKEYFKGYLTASRSIFLEDPKTGTVFSSKVSTNRTGGLFKEDKKMHKWDIESSHLSNRLAQKILESNGDQFKNLVLLQEPLGLFVDVGPQQGFLIRSLQPMQNENYYLPGFAALNDKVGREIALKNGSTDPLAFWTKHYAEPLGKAMAEFAAHFGYSLTSAHNQQFMIELDKDMKPTGKILLRDFGDSHLYSKAFERTANAEDKELYSFYQRFDSRTHEYLPIYFGLFHGMRAPSWANFKKGEQKEMAQAFYRNFDLRFSELTGIPVDHLLSKKPTVNKPPRYSLKSYDPSYHKSTEAQYAWSRYLNAIDCFHGAKRLANGRSCKEVLNELRLVNDAEAYQPATALVKCRPQGTIVKVVKRKRRGLISSMFDI